jgi:multidrug transporter EmrE-like cation transporter
MTAFSWWILFTVAVGFEFLGDIFIKKAGISNPISWYLFGLGFIAYSLPSFGWLFLMRGKALSVIGTVYPVITAVGLALIGVLVFHETISKRGLVGIALGVLSIFLLSSKD